MINDKNEGGLGSELVKIYAWGMMRCHKFPSMKIFLWQDLQQLGNS